MSSVRVRLTFRRARRPRCPRRRAARAAILALLFGIGQAAAAAPALVPVVSASGPPPTGVAVAGGRMFVESPRLDPATPNPSVAVIGPDGTPIPYPGGDWNAWKPGADPAHRFVSAAAIHVGPAGNLWVVDNGVVGLVGRQAVANAAKIVVLDPRTNAVARIYPVPRSALRPRSAIAAIRFNGAHAYVADSGAPAILVLDLATGAWRRVLDGDKSTAARRPAIIDGRILRGPDGKPVLIHADELEVTPDGQFLYVQPLSGPLYRVETKLLDDPAVKPAILSAAVEFWYNTPSLGGTAIDGAGNLYLDDLGSRSVLRLTPDRHVSLLVRDDRLHWPAAPAFDGHGNLLIPAAQIDRAAPFNGGRSAFSEPFQIFSLRVGASRPANQ